MGVCGGVLFVRAEWDGNHVWCASIYSLRSCANAFECILCQLTFRGLYCMVECVFRCDKRDIAFLDLGVPVSLHRLVLIKPSNVHTSICITYWWIVSPILSFNFTFFYCSVCVNWPNEYLSHRMHFHTTNQAALLNIHGIMERFTGDMHIECIWDYDNVLVGRWVTDVQWPRVYHIAQPHSYIPDFYSHFQWPL